MVYVWFRSLYDPRSLGSLLRCFTTLVMLVINSSFSIRWIAQNIKSICMLVVISLASCRLRAVVLWYNDEPTFFRLCSSGMKRTQGTKPQNLESTLNALRSAISHWTASLKRISCVAGMVDNIKRRKIFAIVGSSRFSKWLQFPMSIAGIFRSPVTLTTLLWNHAQCTT